MPSRSSLSGLAVGYEELVISSENGILHPARNRVMQQDNYMTDTTLMKRLRRRYENAARRTDQNDKYFQPVTAALMFAAG